MSSKGIKLAVWYVLVLVFGLWLWGYAGQAHFSSLTGIAIQVLPLIAFLMLTSLTVVGYALFGRESLGATGIIVLLFLFTFGFTVLNIIGGLLALAFCMEGYRRVQQELTQRTHVNTTQFLKTGLYSVVVALFVMISFAAAQSDVAVGLARSQTLPLETKSFFEQIIKASSGSTLTGVSDSEKDVLISQATSQLYDSANNFLKPYFVYAPAVIGIGLFLILWGVSFIFVWLALAVGLLWFWVLRKTKIVTIVERDVKAQEIEV